MCWALAAGYYRVVLLLAGAGVVLRCCSMDAGAPPAPVADPPLRLRIIGSDASPNAKVALPKRSASHLHLIT